MKDQIREFIVTELLAGRDIGTDEDLLISGLVDSLGVMRLVTFIEDHLATPVPPEDVTIENFATIDTIGAYVEQRAEAP